MKRLDAIVILFVVFLASFYLWGVPVFAQTHLAASIPGQPLSALAAEEIIIHSGLPAEKLPGDITNELTRGRDAVNAYRDAHQKLSEKGWYRGIGDDHTPLLTAMVNELDKQGYKSAKVVLTEKTAEVLEIFWKASDEQNAKELGFGSVEDMNDAIIDLQETGKDIEVKQLSDELATKWK